MPCFFSPVEMGKRDLMQGTIVEAAALFRAGNCSPQQLLMNCLERIDRLDPMLCAFIRRRDEQAAATARAATAVLQSGEARSPLTGIPLAHKDMFARAGEVLTFGAHPHRSQTPTVTATVKQRLDVVLALDLGGLNMSEYAAGPTGINPHHGRCCNP